MILDELEDCRKGLVQARIEITEAITLIMSMEGAVSRGLPIEKEKMDTVFDLLDRAAIRAAGTMAEFDTGDE